MPTFEVTIEFTGKAKYKIEEVDAKAAEGACREFFEKGFETSKKLPESISEDPENPIMPDFVVDEAEQAVEVESVTSSRFIGDAEKDLNEKRIVEAYGTTDVDKIFVEASARRLGSVHLETIVDGITSCGTCGRLDVFYGDPIFHPEQWL